MKKLIRSLAAGAALFALNAVAEPVHVAVDTAASLCTNFLGFGVQWSAYPEFDITDARWQKVFERLDFMRVPLVRLMMNARTFCDGFDARGHPIYHWSNNYMKKMYRLLDYCERRHVAVVLGEWHHNAPGGVNDESQSTLVIESDARWHRVIADFVEHLCNEKHYTCIQYYNFLNEPNSKKSGYSDFCRWAAALKSMSVEFTKRGLDEKIKIIGPDATWLPNDGYWLDLTVQQTAAEIGAYDFHYYIKPADLESDFLENFCWMKKDYIDRFDEHGQAKPFLWAKLA